MTTPTLLAVKSDAETYYDTTSDSHNALLPEALRDHTDLANIALKAEKDVIEHFTREGGSPPTRAPYDPEGVYRYELTDDNGDGLGIYVYLKEYELDPEEADGRFADAMIREIAEVIRWQAVTAKLDPTVSSESSGVGRSKSYQPDSRAMFPPQFPRYLGPYSTKPVAWAL